MGTDDFFVKHVYFPLYFCNSDILTLQHNGLTMEFPLSRQ